jgi:3-(3-hydroxy-phenyl)propionate hydroxylase
VHQPSTAPRASIYYDYQVHPFVRPKEMGGQRKRHPVVVVGAGPIGLATALDLARHGVACVLVTADVQVSEGSRALAFTRRSMEILQQVGVGERIAAQGLPWRHGNSYYRGQRIYRMDLPYEDDDRFAPLTNLQQQYVEEYLADRIAEQPLVELRWGHKVVGVSNSGEGVTLTVDTPQGEYELESEWVVACDGARSPIRQALGLRMEGASYEGRFVIADIRCDLGLPTERLAFFDPSWNPGNTVLMHREPHGLWRVDYQLPPGETPEEALQPSSMKARIDAQLEMIGKGGTRWEMDWCSVYSARAMTLTDYVQDRVIFAGDAAHMLPIFGVRGANTGFQDGHNLAWKLALRIRGQAGPGLLATYTSERVQAAFEIIDEASKSVRFMTPPTPGFRLLRDAVLSLSLTQDYARPLLNWRTSRPHEYIDSPLNCADDDNALFTGGPGHGAQIRNVRLGAGAYLMDRLGASFYLLLFADEVPRDLAEAAQALRRRGVPIGIVLLQPSADAGEATGADLVVDDSAGRARERFGITRGGGAYLVRPDQHVCARWLTLDGEGLTRAVRTALGHGKDPR